VRIFGFAPPERAKEVIDLADIVGEEERTSPSPSLYELEDILQALRAHDPINVRLTRTQLKWTAKASRKYLGINYPHPYRKP
jgi:hypothetical protein